MKTLATKGIIALSGIGVFSGGTYYIVHRIQNSKSESEKIKFKESWEKKGYTLLSKGSSKINDVLKNYKKIVSQNSAFGFQGFLGDNIGNKSWRYSSWKM